MNMTRVITSKEEFAKALSYIELVSVASVLTVISVLTVMGNALVMLSFIMDKKLRTLNNYFLLSLAISDILIGAFSMPLFTQYLLRGEWTLGRVLCDMWLAQDYMCSNASCLNLLAIGLDRYFSVTSPLRYRARRTGKRVALMISCVWIISFLIWPPWIYAWQFIEGRRTIPEDECYVQFLETNFYVTIITSVLDYYAPLSIMLILYYKIWRETKKRGKYLASLEGGLQYESLPLQTNSGRNKTARMLFACYSKSDSGKQESDEAGGDTESALMRDIPNNTTTGEAAFESDEEEPAFNETTSSQQKSSDLNTLSEHTITSSSETVQSKSSSKRLVAIKNDNKAARVLTAILLAFIVTTTPYNVLVIVKNLDATHSMVPDAVWNFFYYLFYVNSTLNPVCYALANRNFRRTYWKILTCSWSKKSSQAVYSFSNYSDKSLQSSQNLRYTTSL